MSDSEGMVVVVQRCMGGRDCVALVEKYNTSDGGEINKGGDEGYVPFTFPVIISYFCDDLSYSYVSLLFMLLQSIFLNTFV